MCFECGCLGHIKEHCPHIVRQGPSASEARLKEGGEMCSSSHFAHVPDEARSGEGTSGVLHDSEQSTEQVDVRESMYGPWIVVARRKNSTKPLRSGGTSPCQRSGVSIKNTEYVDEGSSDRAALLDGVTRETKRKLAPQKFLDKSQIASVVQSFRKEGKYQAQPSPTLMLKSNDISHTIDWPISAQNSLGLSSVKAKKGATRSRVINGD